MKPIDPRILALSFILIAGPLTLACDEDSTPQTEDIVDDEDSALYPRYESMCALAEASCGTSVEAEFLRIETSDTAPPLTTYVFEVSDEEFAFTDNCGQADEVFVACRDFDFEDPGQTWFIAYRDLGSRLEILDAYSEIDGDVRSAYGDTANASSLEALTEEFNAESALLVDCSMPEGCPN